MRVVEDANAAARGRQVNLSELSIRRPVFATVMSLLLVVLGVIAYTRLTLRELPAIDPADRVGRRQLSRAPRPPSSRRA